MVGPHSVTVWRNHIWASASPGPPSSPPTAREENENENDKKGMKSDGDAAVEGAGGVEAGDQGEDAAAAAGTAPSAPAVARMGGSMEEGIETDTATRAGAGADVPGADVVPVREAGDSAEGGGVGAGAGEGEGVNAAVVAGKGKEGALTAPAEASTVTPSAPTAYEAPAKAEPPSGRRRGGRGQGASATRVQPPSPPPQPPALERQKDPFILKLLAAGAHVPLSPSSSSASDAEDAGADAQAQMQGQVIGRHEADLESGPPEDSVTCRWDECGLVFTHLPTLIEHIHNEHIGVHKSNYTCEWATCQRRGLAQTSRFALISHIRSHTGEKPFTCLRPECDKSFTRSDALAKHMRLQHGIEPPAPGRGGSKKRKRGQEDQPAAAATGAGAGHRVHSPAHAAHAHAHAHHGAGGTGGGTAGGGSGGFSTFKIEPNAYADALGGGAGAGPGGPGAGAVDANGVDELEQLPSGHMYPRSMSPLSPQLQQVLDARFPSAAADGVGTGAGAADEDGYASDAEEALPAYLRAHYVPATNRVLGRSPAMAMYLLMKAKHRYALEQQDVLLEELRAARAELRKEREEKDSLLDSVLRNEFGDAMTTFLGPLPLPPCMEPSTSSVQGVPAPDAPQAPETSVNPSGH